MPVSGASFASAPGANSQFWKLRVVHLFSLASFASSSWESVRSLTER